MKTEQSFFKTKLVCPWNLKVGQKLIQVNIDGERRAHKIISIKKRRGYFTGKSIWHVVTDGSMFPWDNFHASNGKSLKLQKAEIVVDS